MVTFLRAATITLGSIVLVSTVLAVDPERDFSGNWVLDPAVKAQPQAPVAPDKKVAITQDDSVIRYSVLTQGASPALRSYLLDGTETRSHVGGETRSSIVKWEGSALLINTQVSGKQEFTIMDRWKVSSDHSKLTISRQIVQRSGTIEQTFIYRREAPPGWRNASTAAPASPPQGDSTNPFPTPEALDAALTGHAAAASPDIIVPAGTRMGLSLRNAVDTKHSHEGDHVYLQTIAPISVDNRIVIPQGSFVNGTITISKPAHGVKGKGEMYLRFDSLVLPNGVTRNFGSHLASADSSARGQVDAKEGKITGERDGTGDAPTVALGTGAGAGVGGIAGAAAGHPIAGAGIGAAAGAAAGLATIFHSKRPEVVLPQGTTLEMVLDRDLQFSPSELPF
jgi:hypothetical protein